MLCVKRLMCNASNLKVSHSLFGCDPSQNLVLVELSLQELFVGQNKSDVTFGRDVHRH